MSEDEWSNLVFPPLLSGFRLYRSCYRMMDLLYLGLARGLHRFHLSKRSERFLSSICTALTADPTVHMVKKGESFFCAKDRTGTLNQRGTKRKYLSHHSKASVAGTGKSWRGGWGWLGWQREGDGGESVGGLHRSGSFGASLRCAGLCRGGDKDQGEPNLFFLRPKRVRCLTFDISPVTMSSSLNNSVRCLLFAAPEAENYWISRCLFASWTCKWLSWKVVLLLHSLESCYFWYWFGSAMRFSWLLCCLSCWLSLDC